MANSTCQPKYHIADVCHDNETSAFHAMGDEIRLHQQSKGCPPKTCAFLQFHGKFKTACVNDTMFVSAGLGAKYASFYTDHPNLPANRLAKALMRANSSWTAHTPAESGCTLVASENILGRLINGISEGNECTVAATATTATGQFIHVEQAPEVREPAAYAGWTAAIREAFEPSCAPGFYFEQAIGLCAKKRALRVN